MSQISPDLLALERLYFWEKSAPTRVALTQPMGAGVTLDLTWSEVAQQVRCMATFLQAQGLGARLQGGDPVQELRLVDDDRPGHLDGRPCVGTAVSHAGA